MRKLIAWIIFYFVVIGAVHFYFLKAYYLGNFVIPGTIAGVFSALKSYDINKRDYLKDYKYESIKDRLFNYSFFAIFLLAYCILVLGLGINDADKFNFLSKWKKYKYAPWIHQ